MDDVDEQIDLTMLLASSVHDIKNSLSVLLNNLEDLGDRCAASGGACGDLIPTLQLQGRGLRNDLLQLLALYRINNTGYRPAVSSVEVAEFLEERLIEHEVLFKSQGIALSMQCPAGLHGSFDRELVSGVLNNALNNALRYATGRIVLTGVQEQDLLVLRVMDDGPGYPAAMLGAAPSAPGRLNLDSGSTGLGLYFCSAVAARHRKGRCQGRIELSNGGDCGGGCFALYLP